MTTTPRSDVVTALALVREPSTPADRVRDVLAAVLDADPAAGVGVALELLAAEPRERPSRGLLVDPGDTVRARWSRRVAAAAALLESDAVLRVYDELLDELVDSSELAADTLAVAAPNRGLDQARRDRLLALG